MKTAVTFLQTERNEPVKSVGGYQAGSTEQIRSILRAQKRECEDIKRNSLFRELRQKVAEQARLAKYRNDNYDAPAVDDIELEGRRRALQVITKAAHMYDKDLLGIWAEVGKPYKGLGEPQQVSNKLPKLSRDAFASSQKRQQSKDDARVHGMGLQEESDINSKEAQTDNDRKYEIMEDKLLSFKSFMLFSRLERMECRFPKVAVKVSNNRLSKARTAASPFYSPTEAESSQVDADNWGGQPQDQHHEPGVGYSTLKGQNSNASVGQLQLQGNDGTSGKRAQSFVLNEDSGSVDSVGAQPGKAGRVNTQGATGASQGATGTVQGARATLQGGDLEKLMAPQMPIFAKLTEKVRPRLGDDGNPVYQWHNDFQQVRQENRKKMQQLLWDRTQGRSRVKSDIYNAMGFYTSVMVGMEVLAGKKSAMILSAPKDPWEQAKRFTVDKSKSSNVYVGVQLEVDDIMIMERVYDQMCLLVQYQKPSDPLLLIILHKCKELLEAGNTVSRPLVSKLLQHVGHFVKGAGMTQYNPHVLPLITFVRKCAGVSDADIEHQLDQNGLYEVVYPLNIQEMSVSSLSRPPSRQRHDADSSRAGRSGSPLSMPSSPIVHHKAQGEPCELAPIEEGNASVAQLEPQ